MKTGKKFLASTLLAAATLTFCTTSVSAAYLGWRGTESSHSWTTTYWQIIKNGTGTSPWSDNDYATFDGNATYYDVTVDGVIKAKSITVSDCAYTFTFSDDDYSITTETLTIDSGASLTISENTTLIVSGDTTINGALTLSGGYVTLGGTSGSVTLSKETSLSITDATTVGMGDLSVTGGTVRITDSGTATIGDVTIKSDYDWSSGTYYTAHVYISSEKLIMGDLTISSHGVNSAYSVLNIYGGETTMGDVTLSGYYTQLMLYGGTVVMGDVTISSGAWLETSSAYSSTYGATSLTMGKVTVGGTSGSSVGLWLDSGDATLDSLEIIDYGLCYIDNDKTTIKDTVSVSSKNATLTIGRSGTNRTATMVTLYSAISNTGTVTITSNAVFVLDNLTSNGDTYTIISGGTITGWDTLTNSNFVLNGSELTTHVDVSVAGQITLNAVADLVWTGSDSNVWTNDSTVRNWTNNSYVDHFCEGDSVTFDSTASNKSVSISEALEPDTVTVSGSGYTFAFSDEGSLTASSLTISDGASLTIEGTASITTSSAVINGTLEIAGTVTIASEILTSTGSLSVSKDASLGLSGTVDISSAISNSGTVTVSDSTVFALDNLTSDDGTYTLITGTGKIEGWDTLNRSNFLLDGSTLKHSSLDLSTDGEITIKTVGLDLVWNGTSTDYVWTNDGKEVWLFDEYQDAFVAGDNVTFGADGTKSVSIVGTIEAGTVTVTGSGYTFTFLEDSSVTADSLTVEYGGSLEISGAGSLAISNSATVDGTLKITGGTTNFQDYVYVGDSISSTGTIEILDGETTFSRYIYVGNGGTGKILICGGETTFSNWVYLGYYGDSCGIIEIYEGTTTFSQGVEIGSDTSGNKLKISGGTTTIANGMFIGASFSARTVGSVGTGIVEISGGTTTIAKIVYVGYTSSSDATSTGTIEISGGETTFSGTVYVGYALSGTTNGTIKISGGETTFEGNVYVGYVRAGYENSSTSNGTIEISGGTITLFSAIENSGTVTIEENSDVVFVLDNLTSDDGTYTLITGTGTIEGWDALDKSNFSLNGSVLSGHATVDLSTDGQVTVIFGSVADLIWAGTSTDNVWMNDGENVWLSDEIPAAFVSGDNVIFGTDGEKAVSIVGKIEAGNITVSGSGYTFTFSENSSVTADSLTIDSGASLSLEGSVELKVSSAEINGTLGISGGTAKIEKTISIGENGSLAVSGASLTASSVDVSGSLEVSDGSLNAESLTVKTSGKATLYGGTVNIDSVIVEESGSLSITGSETTITDLTSSGTVSVSTGASLELSGTIDLSSAITSEGTITLGDNVVFVLDNLGNGDTYTIISGSGEIEDWSTLTRTNFMLDGSVISGRSNINVETSGQVTIIFDACADLVWDGTASSNVWTNNGDKIWLNGTDSDYFYSYDNVTFGIDGTKSVSVVGAIEAGSVTVTGSSYIFTFSEDSSVTADSLTVDSGASLALEGSGELTVSSAEISGSLKMSGDDVALASDTIEISNSGTLEISSGEATITSVEVSSEGTLKVSGGTTTADSIEVAGSLELTGGELTVKTITLSDGSGSFSGGILNVGGITGDGSLSFGNGLTVNLYDTTSLSLTSDITLSGSVTFNAEDSETIELCGTLSGSGKLVKDGDGTLTLSGDNTFSGGTTISSGTIVAQSDTALGSGSIAINDGTTLEIPASREFTNATSGNGTLSITNDAIVSFTKSVGVQTVEVAYGATLSGATTLTHSNAQLVLAGELALDASAGEQISFTNGGTVTIEGTATLNLSGISPTSIKPLSDSSTLGAGSNITIFSGATVEGDLSVAEFLATDSTLSELSSDYAVVYDTSKGLTVMILESGNVSSITSGVKLHDGISSDFLSAIVSDDDLDFGTGIKSSDDLQSLSNPLVKALATGNLSEAAKMAETISPLSYAAMVAMPTTSFYNDVKAIDNRLAARRGKLDENARWEFFAQAQGTFIENDDADDTQTFDFDLYGVLAGADYRVNEGLTVGVTVGYDYGKADIHNSGGKIESDDVRITLFAGQQIGEMFFVNAGVQVGYGHYEAKRKTALGDAKGDTDGWNAGLFADVGMMLTLSEELKIAARPYVGLAYLHSEVGSFDDNIFDVDDFHGDSLRASIGCGLFWGFDLAEAAWIVGLDASYSHDFCGDEVDIDATCMSTDKDFGLTAKALSKDIFSVGPTVSVGLTKSIDIFAGYAFQAGTDSSTGHNLNAGLKVTF